LGEEVCQWGEEEEDEGGRNADDGLTSVAELDQVVHLVGRVKQQIKLGVVQSFYKCPIVDPPHPLPPSRARAYAAPQEETNAIFDSRG